MRRTQTLATLAVTALGTWLPSATARASDEGFLVLRRGDVLEAMRPDGRQRQVLRRKFSVYGRDSWYDSREQNNWNISRDGRRVCFAAVPQDVKFFRALAYRQYLFVLDHNKPVPQVLLRAYGEKSSDDVPGVTGFGYSAPSFDINGSQILVSEEDPDEYSLRASAVLYSVKNRAVKWSTQSLLKEAAPLAKEPGPKLQAKRFYTSALSPDGNHLLCAADSAANGESRLYETDFKHYLVHFDLQKPSVDVLASFDQNIQGITWHPDSKRFVLSASTKGDSDIYVGARDEPSLKQLTHNTGHDFDPIWNRSGTRVFWLSDRPTTPAEAKRRAALATPAQSPRKPFSNQLFSMGPDGSRQRAEFPRLSSIDSLRWTAAMPSWRRYREKQVFAAVGIKS